MGYLICENCGGYYELQEGESPDDFQNCECGGELKFIDNIEDYYNKDKSSTEESIESISKPKEEKKKSNKENINNQLKNNKEIITHYCPECGTKNSGIAVFCKECGKQLNSKIEPKTNQIADLTTNSTKKPPKKPSKKKWIIIAVIGIIILGVYLNNYYNPINSAVRDGNLDALSEYAIQGTFDEKKAAINGFTQIKSIESSAVYNNTNSPDKSKVVNLLISIVKNDPDVSVKDSAIQALGMVYNDDAVNFLNKLQNNQDDLKFSDTGSLLDSDKNLIKSSAKAALEMTKPIHTVANP